MRHLETEDDLRRSDVDRLVCKPVRGQSYTLVEFLRDCKKTIVNWQAARKLLHIDPEAKGEVSGAALSYKHVVAMFMKEKFLR